MENTDWLERMTLITGEKAMKKLNKSHVLVVGLGGVGSFAAEFIARAGVGKMTIVDGDVVDPTNRNRQLCALKSTEGMSKAQYMKERLLDINPELDLTVRDEFLSPESAYEIVDEKMDFVIDCIDSVSPKLNLLVACKHNKVKVASSMGAGGKIDASKIKVTDISKTYHCKFAKQIRKRLKKRSINKGIRVVFSTEQNIKDSLQLTDGSNFKKSFYGTMSYMPALFGAMVSAEAIKSITKAK
ncbi:MAG: tRNA threonylcarbamoyladenosine dehydratase [Flavobacteriales bacterium]|jgi:tRNA A37 threonylcarbamoyladenosine dehydratase|nr:tRNA threonylcarbamoyladenosine dehydratase [Flavobacteriales bacterium]